MRANSQTAYVKIRMSESWRFDLFDRQALGSMAAVIHTIISFVSRIFGYLSTLHRLPFSSDMRDVPLSKDIRYPLTNTSIRSTARHRELVVYPLPPRRYSMSLKASLFQSWGVVVIFRSSVPFPVRPACSRILRRSLRLSRSSRESSGEEGCQLGMVANVRGQEG